MPRLPSPPSPPLLLLLSLLVICLHQTVQSEASAADGAGMAAAHSAPAGVRGTSASCGTGQYILLGRCHRQRGAGTLCLSDSWCRSGRCRLGLCRRGQRGTDDCRSGRPACGDGQQCVSEADGWRCRAEDGTLALGAACSLDSECASGTCSAEGDAAGTCGCPADFTACAGHCYKATGRFQYRPAAVDVCHTLGTILATPRSEEENDCLLSVSKAQRIEAAGIWLGYARSGDDTDEFIGDDALPMNYTNWHPAALFDSNWSFVVLSFGTDGSERTWLMIFTSEYTTYNLGICQM